MKWSRSIFQRVYQSSLLMLSFVRCSSERVAGDDELDRGAVGREQRQDGHMEADRQLTRQVVKPVFSGLEFADSAGERNLLELLRESERESVALGRIVPTSKNHPKKQFSLCQLSAPVSGFCAAFFGTYMDSP